MDVTARRLGWTQADGGPEYVSGELVILDAGAGLQVVSGPPDAHQDEGAEQRQDQEAAARYAVHLVDGYAVDPESVVALRWADLHPTTTSRPPSSSRMQGPPAAAP